jgi:hypothetical protein
MRQPTYVGKSPWRRDDPWDPRNPENRDRTRMLIPQLRARLLSWDPIGVAASPQAQDEYDCLISPLMHRLSDGVSAAELGAWLIEEMREHFGITPNESREHALAVGLKRWWDQATADA